jgi:hypothetical protein
VAVGVEVIEHLYHPLPDAVISAVTVPKVVCTVPLEILKNAPAPVPPNVALGLKLSNKKRSVVLTKTLNVTATPDVAAKVCAVECMLVAVFSTNLSAVEVPLGATSPSGVMLLFTFVT